MSVCTLLTDFGRGDYYVAALTGVIATRAPGTRTVDITHEVAPGDVEGGAWLLAAAAPWFPPGTVHLVVVDPGVGSDRRILAASAGGHRFVGPDNGLLLPAVEAAAERAGEPPELRAAERPDLWLDGPGSTFHGRDRFAPTAAALLAGEPLSELGPPLADPVRLDFPHPTREELADGAGEILRGRIAHIDRFGNLITDLPAPWLESVTAGDGVVVELEVDGRVHSVGKRVSHYAEIPGGEPAWLVGSLGTVEISLAGESLAERWRVRRGCAVVVRRMG